MDSIEILFYIGGFLIVSLSVLSVKLLHDISNLRFDLKLGKMNCQKDLDRLEEKINRVINSESKQVQRDIDKLDKIQKSLQTIIDNEIKTVVDLKNATSDLDLRKTDNL